MKTLKVSNTDSITITATHLVIEGMFYCHHYKLTDTLKVDYLFRGSDYWIEINTKAYFKFSDRAIIKKAYTFITSAMKDSHENPSLR